MNALSDSFHIEQLALAREARRLRLERSERPSDLILEDLRRSAKPQDMSLHVAHLQRPTPKANQGGKAQ